MFDPHDPSQMRKLNTAVRTSFRELDSFRQNRLELVKEFVGTYYSDGGSEREQPVNMLALTLDIYMMHMAGNNPRVLLPTTRTEIMPFLADVEAVVNQELYDMNFASTLRRWIADAFFCIGVIKCGIVDTEYVEIIPGEPQPGQDYFAEIVDFDDFVFDTEAKWWDKITFIGDSYKVDYEAVMDDDSYDSKAKELLTPRQRDSFDRYEFERVSEISHGTGSEETNNDNNFKPQVRIWDVCLPEEGLIITMPDHQDVTRPFKVVEWDGTQSSPYFCLYFQEVPGNAMPLPPGANLRSLNKTLNTLMRKLVEQAKRQKTVGLFRSGNVDDAEKIRKASDGELIPVEHPDVVNEVSFGGPEQQNLAFSQLVRDVYSTMAGNLDSLGGLGPQSETFRQDAMIQATVSQKAAKMQTIVVDGTEKIVRELLYRIWTDPINTYQSQRDIPDLDMTVGVQIEPGPKPVDFKDIRVKVEPYSMQYRSPRERATEITTLLTQVAFPMLPFLQQQGINLNLQNLFQYLSKYLDLPELNQIFEYSAPPVGGLGEDNRRMEQTSSPVSHRTYERVNRPGATREGNTQTMLNLAAGGNPQQSEQAALGRSTGV